MSFFKRAVISALTRREELREENINKFDEDVERGLKILDNASKNKKASDTVIKNRNKIIRPLQISAKAELGFTPSIEATTYVYNTLAGKDPEKTTKILSSLSESVIAGKQRQEDMPSTTGSLTAPQQMSQAFAENTEQTIRTEGETPETMGSRVTSTVLGTLLGRAPNRSVSETVRQKYIDTFENEEQGQNVYNELMNYRKRAIEGDPSEMPDVDPVEAKILNAEARKIKAIERLDTARLPVRKYLRQELADKLKEEGVNRPPELASLGTNKDGTAKAVIDANVLADKNDIKDKARIERIRTILRHFNVYRQRFDERVEEYYLGPKQYSSNGQAVFERVRTDLYDDTTGLKNNIFTGTDNKATIAKTNAMNNKTRTVQVEGGEILSRQEFIEMFTGASDFKKFMRDIYPTNKQKKFQTEEGMVIFQQDPATSMITPYLFRGQE